MFDRDNIVRSHARLLRQKLEAYFEDEGRSEPVRIVIPKGAYVPAFEAVLIPEPGEPVPKNGEPVAETGEVAPPERSRRWMLAAAGAPALAVAGYGGSRLLRTLSPTERLWQAMFDGERRTLVVTADASLVLVQDLTGQKVTLPEYANGDYVRRLTPPAGMTRETLLRIARRRYTGVVDAKLTSRLAQRPEANQSTMIRYARDLRMGELKGANAIFLGAPHANPWIELYQRQLNFWLDLDLEKSEFVVQNRSPRPGEQANYQTKLTDPRRPVWGVLSHVPNVDGTGHVLILAGASIPGTESLEEFLLDDRRMDEFLAQGRATGRRIPYFNALLETDRVDGNAEQTRLLASRFF